ncbi:MAG TPA: hypothetical protein PLS56_02780 [Candidatus Dojkabacteria bacterium]|nr:hypothetical protein [Candidatus Dojkabacteria bacterium]
MKEFNKLIQEQFLKMCATGKLFVVEAPNLWHTYLSNFPKDQNPIFRDPASSSHNCNLCHNFVRRYADIVAIDENLEIMTIFDVEADEEYNASAKALATLIRKSPIKNVFFETWKELNSLPYAKITKKDETYQLGMASNVKRYTKEEAEKYGVVKANEIRTFEHMHLFVPKKFVKITGVSKESAITGYRYAKNVFQRAMETISVDTLELVKDLINQGSLLDGTTHLYKIEQIIPLKKEYDEINSPEKRERWCWIASYDLPFAKFRNELIGVLCAELSEGEEINKACESWNRRVDPRNYMKATAPITKKQIEEAKKFVIENGYEESFNRRLATIEDVKVSEILHSNTADTKEKSVSIFDGVKSTSTRHKRNEFEGVEEVTIEKFMKDILPTLSSIEVYLDNKHENNFVSLTTANNPDSKKIFKWNNNYSWTFNGNLAGKSQIKEAVKAAGGKIVGDLRFSITWNEGGNDYVDFDAHCQSPHEHIYYASYRGKGNPSPCGGNLDVDMIAPRDLGVENIVYADKKKMRDGNYVLSVKHFSGDGKKGFKAEIEMDGETFTYSCDRHTAGFKHVATVTLKDGKFSIKHMMPETQIASKEVYGLETKQFHKVNLMCLSPNHWDGNNVGNKHYFFMLDGCRAPNAIRGFHNENLIPELAAHRKVLEVLGATAMIEPKEKKQLCGLGFNATVRDEVLARIQGSHKRVVKIKF